MVTGPPVPFSAIAAAATPPALTDQILGLTAGTTDNLYTVSQLASTIVGNGIAFGNNIVYSGASGPSNSWIWNAGTISGIASAAPDGFISPFNILISEDSVDTTTSGNSALNGFTLFHKVFGGYTGSRNAILVELSIRGPAAANATYTSGTFLATTNSNLGGTSGAYTNYKGGIFGANPDVFLLSGATNIISAVGQETDVAIPTGANAANKFGHSIVLTGNDRNRGDYDDAGISFGIQGGATTTWKRGISFGQYAGGWVFGTDSTLIGAQNSASRGQHVAGCVVGHGFFRCDVPERRWFSEIYRVFRQSLGGYCCNAPE